jgi:hypothetical protein
MKRGKSGEDSARDLVCPTRARAEKACSIIDDLIEPVVPAVQRQVATCGDYPLRWARMASGFCGIFSETQTEQLRAQSSSSSSFAADAGGDDRLLSANSGNSRRRNVMRIAVVRTEPQ